MGAEGARPHDGKGKAPPSAGRRWLVGLSYFAISSHHPAGTSKRNAKHFSTLSAIAILAHRGTSVSRRDDELRIRLGRIRDRGRNSRRTDSFIGEVMRAGKRAGHVGESFGGGPGGARRSRFGRGRGAAVSLSLRSGWRRVVTKVRVIRHTGSRFRSAPLSNHVIYLKRDGVTHDGADARMFDARSDAADERAFAERCRDDRHHFRFIVSPEDAAELQDLRTFTRELMADAERDLGTRLDWVAVDHWNTDNPHVHVLIRGRGDDGKDLVISRADIIKTMHRAMARAGREPEVSMFALQGEDPADPVLGRLVARGLHDELTGSAYAIVECVDGRTHHVRFSDIEMTGDAKPGAIVEARANEDAAVRKMLLVG